MNIQEAIQNLEDVKAENAKRITQAEDAITVAIGATFFKGVKVKSADKEVNKKDGSTAIKEGAEYTVHGVIGEKVAVLGKGGSVKVFEYTDLTLVTRK